MTNQEYADLYKTTVRNVCRWKTKRAPLDQPEKMIDWLAGHRSRSGIGKFCRRSAGERPNPPGLGQQTVENVPYPAPDKPVLVELNEKGLGLSATIQRLREAERAFAEEAVKIGSNAAIQKWITVAEELRRIEASNPEISKANDASVDRDKVIAAWLEVETAADEILSAVPTRMALALEGLDAVDIELKLKDEIRRVRAALHDLNI